jgi:hypothetical protein
MCGRRECSDEHSYKLFVGLGSSVCERRSRHLMARHTQ